jgi:hypothetical protein
MPISKLTNEQSAAMERAKQLFSDWRNIKSGRERIPNSLWNAAADLFHTWGLGINKIANSLRLNYTALKTKINETPSVEVKAIDDTESTPTFIEVESPHLSSDCIIEMEKQSGLKMRMCFRGRADPAVISLGRYFLEDHP